MHLDLPLTVGGALVGFLVGLTGMGGGALMTPMLVLLFGVQPLTAVSSDLVASLVMKPVGGAVHARRGTVNLRLVRWLVLGSVPGAFAGSLLLHLLGSGETLQHRVSLALGVALLLAAVTIPLKATLNRRRGIASAGIASIGVRPLPTVLIGLAGGLVVGITSVGSGSLMIVLLLLLYPTLTAAELVGTDLVQAIPLVGAAALGHLLFGHVQFGLTTSLLVGAVPGVYLGARVSASAPDRIVRPALVLVLTASALKLLGAPTPVVLWATGAAAAGFVAAAVVAARQARSAAAPVAIEGLDGAAATTPS